MSESNDGLLRPREEIGMAVPETPDEAQAWERASLAELRKIVERLRDVPDQPKISEVYLDGEYPATKICVRVRDRSSKERTRCFELWGSSFKAPKGLETPDQVAQLVHTWVR